MVIGKPKFQLNDPKGNFHTYAFQPIPSLKETPYSSDLFGFSLWHDYWVVNNFYRNLEIKYDNDHQTMNSIELSILHKLKPKYDLENGSNLRTVTQSDFLKDISPKEGRFIFEQSFDVSIEMMKKQVSVYTGYVNRLNSKATINDLPEILRSYKDHMSRGIYDRWKLNYLDEALLNNAKWE